MEGWAQIISGASILGPGGGKILTEEDFFSWPTGYSLKGLPHSRLAFSYCRLSLETSPRPLCLQQPGRHKYV